MRWVDRGPEPSGVDRYARQFTQGWIDYFRNAVGGRPADSHWREFRPTLGSRTNGICWYCERQCDTYTEYGGRAPTVDHFRPLSIFPQLAYVWANWIFSCQRCNSENKQDKWPDSGYVDPSVADVSERPEKYFEYDSQTGELIPKKDLTGANRQKALHTINDLGLNKLDVRYFRFEQSRRFVEDLLAFPASYRQPFIASFTERSVEFAGTIGMVVEQLRRDGRI